MKNVAMDRQHDDLVNISNIIERESRQRDLNDPPDAKVKIYFQKFLMC